MKQRDGIYIAGPMRGIDKFNFPMFFEAQQALKAHGYKNIINPAAIDTNEGFDPETASVTEEDLRRYILRDIKLIVEECCCICLLPGWEHSKGAAVEVAIGEFLGLDFLTLWPHQSNVSIEQNDPKHVAWVVRNGRLPTPGDKAPLPVHAEDILEEALRITKGDRQAQYGPPDQDFRRTAAMWSALKGVEFTAKDVALFMILLKCSRETHQNKRDNLVDIAGYARCASLIP